ncbi:AAA family ATPase [Allorhizocola rhizosphaerae]|uniref:AAA family ATPase n=1 Tax=Allorhizocola rhizosphaerae TaxID=1872709 RepID=UPI000E3C48B7|nr:AAA family ATPase [Allorhizocola rhizosphaerae]
MRAADASPVGREAEVQRLQSIAREAVGGRGATVLVDGEPGIGKTTLLRAMAAECERLGIKTRLGSAQDFERRLPFTAIANCLGPDAGSGDPQLARLAGLLGGASVLGQSIAAANHEFAVIEAIGDLIDSWCAAGPVALLLDDAQWADPSSLLALHRLARETVQQPLVLVIAAPSLTHEEATAGLANTLLARGAELLRLEPLPDPAVAGLVERLLAASVDEDLLGLVSRAGGNPFYINELVTVLSREGAIHTAGGRAEVHQSSVEVPRSLVDVIQQRLHGLPREARDVLQMAAVLGPEIDVTELHRVLDLPMFELTGILSRAIEADLLADTGQRLLFRHDLIREVLADQVPYSVRAALHLRAGQMLAGTTGAPVERTAEHLLAGAELDPGCVQWVLDNADDLIVRAPEIAVSMLERVLALAGETARDALRYHLVRALLWLSKLTEAEQEARNALAALRDPAWAGGLRWLLVQALYRQGRLADTVEAIDEALASPDLSPVDAGRLHGFGATCLFYLERLEKGERWAREAIAIGQEHGEPQASALGHLALAAARFAHGDVVEALRFSDLAVPAFEHGIQPDVQADPYAMRGYCMLELDRLSEADETLAMAVKHNQDTGGVYLTLCYALRARLRFLDGRWDDALAEINTGLDSPDALMQAPGLQALAALIAIHRGTYAQGDGAQRIPEPDTSLGGRKYGYLMRWAQALLLVSQGDQRRALELLYPAWLQAWGLDNRRIIYRICPDLARLAAAVGDTNRSEELVDTTEELVLAQPTPSLAAVAQLCRGLARSEPDLLLAAAEAFHEVGWPLYEGQAYEDAAEALARVGHSGEARVALGKAVVLYGGLDAAWDIVRGTARLRQAGVRLGVRGPRSRPKRGWEALTETEHRVAGLVAEGRSNLEIAHRLFLSRRTVQTHVSNILSKLEVGSRIELALTASRHRALADR